MARAAVSQLIYLHFGADEDRLVRVRESMLAVTKGWDRAQVRQIVRETSSDDRADHVRRGARADRAAPGGRPPRLPGLGLARGDRAPAGRHARRRRRHLLAGEVDEEGRYTGRMAFYAYGESKATAMRELAERTGIDLGASSAYSDSATDLPMLEAVGRPVAVNPDRALAKIARERGWEVRNFTKPIRLRDRRGPHDAGGDDEPGRGRCRAHPVAPRRAEPPQPAGRGRRAAERRSAVDAGLAATGRQSTRRVSAGLRRRRERPGGRG